MLRRPSTEEPNAAAGGICWGVKEVDDAAGPDDAAPQELEGGLRTQRRSRVSNLGALRHRFTISITTTTSAAAAVPHHLDGSPRLDKVRRHSAGSEVDDRVPCGRPRPWHNHHGGVLRPKRGVNANARRAAAASPPLGRVRGGVYPR